MKSKRMVDVSIFAQTEVAAFNLGDNVVYVTNNQFQQQRSARAELAQL